MLDGKRDTKRYFLRVIALVAAGGLAAALSTAAGLLLVISASISHDLIKKIIKPTISEKSELVAARLSAVGAVCVAGYFGIFVGLSAMYTSLAQLLNEVYKKNIFPL